MKKYQSQISLIINVGFILLVLFLIFRKDNQIVKVPGKRTLEKRIEHTKELVPIYLKANNTDKKQIQALGTTIEELSLSLESAKSRRDTVIIVKTQDSLIYVLSAQSNIKDSVITRLEKVVTLQGETIKNQDTLIMVKNNDIKRYKRQRNVTTAVAVLLGGLLIVF
jgi:hypothetical protein